jgi:hypothetical protein
MDFPLWLVFWVIGIAPLLVIFPLMFVVARKQLGPNAGTRQFIMVLPIMLGALIIGPVLFYVLSDDWIENGFAVFQIGFFCFVCTLMLFFLGRRKGAGPVLLDLGRPQQARFLVPVTAFLAIFVAVVVVFDLVTGQVHFENVAKWLFFSSIIVLNAFSTLSRMQIREQGVLMGGDLLRWKKIEGYTWEEDKRNVLTLRVKTPFSLFAKRSIPIPPVYRDQVDTLLAQHTSRSQPQGSKQVQ